MPSVDCARSQNSNYQQDVRYILKLNSWILTSLGIWSTIEQHVSKIIIVSYNFILGFALVPCILNLVYDQKDINIKLKMSGLLIFCFTTIIKYLILVIRQPKIQRCIEYVKYDWWQVTFESDREMMLKYAIVGRNLTIIGALFMYGAGIIYYGFLVPFSPKIKINNQTIRLLVYPMYSKFHQVQISPIYEIIYVAHCICGYFMYSVTIGTVGFTALFVTHTCGQIQIIMSRLQNLLNSKNPDETQNIQQRIAAVVKKHIRMIRFTVIMKETLQEIYLLDFVTSTYMMCIISYNCIVDWQKDDKLALTTFLLLLVSFCFNIFILCYIGELIINKSSQIGSTCYMVDWYQLSPKLARNFILIIAVSSYPIKLRAGRMIDLSLRSFGTVLKTSVAYLNFLRTMM